MYGEVRRNYRIELGTRPEDYTGTPYHDSLVSIFSALQQHRGFTELVRARHLAADFFVPDPGFVVEFDESQHFTEPRRIALSLYPADVATGFSRDAWITRCQVINAHDNDLPFRDEQRAWYDTLRDFLPEIKGYLPIVRLYAKDRVWCEMNPEKKEDVEKFRDLIRKSTVSEIDELLDIFEYSLQEVKKEYLAWAEDKDDNGIGAPKNNEITKEFLKKYSQKNKTSSAILRRIRNYCHTITDPKQRYQIIREVYCIQPSFHELWFWDRHFSMFYEKKFGGIYSRMGLKSIPTSVKTGKLDKRLKSLSTFLLKWVILLDNLYSGRVKNSIFDFSPVDDQKLTQNIKKLLENPNPMVEEVIEDLPLIYETVLTILDRSHYHSLNPDVILKDDIIGSYAPCAINEGPIFHRTSKDPRRTIFSQIDTADISDIRNHLASHFTIVPIFDEKNSVATIPIPNIPSDPILEDRISKMTRDQSGFIARKKTRPQPECWTESAFLARLQEMTGSEKKVEIARKLIAWARNQGLDLGETCPNKYFIPFIGIPPNTQQLFKIKIDGKLVIDFKNINHYSQFKSREKRQQLITELNTIKGLKFTTSSISDLKFPSYDLAILKDPQDYDDFIKMSTWFFDELRKGK
jgi:hypothetical protein